MTKTNDALQRIDRSLCGDIWASPAVNRNLEALCQDCGHRFSGSPSDRCAADFIAGLWQGCGLHDVHLEPFPMVTWERRAASFEMVAPAGRSYPCLALPYAPACNLELDLIDLGYGLQAEVERAGEAVRGRAALVQNGAPQSMGRPVHRLEKYLRAKSAGAAAFIFMDNEPGMLAPTGSLHFDQTGELNQALPGIGIAYETGMDIRRWAGRGSLKVRLALDNRLQRNTSWSVVGDLPGTNPADGRFIMFGAHLDGHDIAQAAVDNGSGVAGISEVARVLAAHQQRLPRTVRFVCFGGEELGLIGAHAYVGQHKDDLGRIQFMFNMDVVGGAPPVSFVTQNCRELMPYFAQAASEMAVEVNVSDLVVPFSDHFPFALQGVPAAFIASSGEKGQRGWGHTAADTLDKVNFQTIRLAAGFTARLAVRMANDVSPWPGRRRSADEVKAALQELGLEPFLRMQGTWPF